MQAYQIKAGQQIAGLERVQRSLPALTAHDVHIRVHAVSLNYRDLMISEGAYFRTGDSAVIPCSDGAGEVIAVGSAVSRFRVGDRVKIRLVNEMDSDHPMHHPFHIHGAGRFLILARDGRPEENLVWKDTVLIRTGETVDILLQISNPGLWMAHCHIAEHHESGMMFSFNVAPDDGDGAAVAASG